VVVLKEKDGRYSVSVPALKGCHTWGETLPEALRMAEDCTALFLESLQARGKPVPPDLESFPLEMGDAAKGMLFKIVVAEREAAEVA
jgi:predicted RNase H-like HicB family nuclease